MQALRWICPDYETSIQLIVTYRNGYVYPVGLSMDGAPFPGADGYISSLGADCYLYEPQGIVERFIRDRLSLTDKQRTVFCLPSSVGRLISENLSCKSLH